MAYLQEILIIALLISSAVFNALMDLSSEDRFKNGWFNKSIGWKYKYKDNDPEKGPKFPGSTTFFVMFTDGWHLFQFLFHSCWQLSIAIALGQPLLAFITIKVIFSLTFELIYSDLKKNL